MERNAGDNAPFQLLQLFVHDLAKTTHSVSLETPLAFKLFKSLSLLIIHRLCGGIGADSATNLSSHDSCKLLELVGNMLLSCQTACQQLTKLKSATQCYCEGKMAAARHAED